MNNPAELRAKMDYSIRLQSLADEKGLTIPHLVQLGMCEDAVIAVLYHPHSVHRDVMVKLERLIKERNLIK